MKDRELVTGLAQRALEHREQKGPVWLMLVDRPSGEYNQISYTLAEAATDAILDLGIPLSASHMALRHQVETATQELMSRFR